VLGGLLGGGGRDDGGRGGGQPSSHSVAPEAGQETGSSPQSQPAGGRPAAG
jgi:hypothetical protein